MKINSRLAHEPPLEARSHKRSKTGWAAVQSLDGRTWDSLDGGQYGLVGADTFMHQARYAIALHDAEVDVLVSKVPGGLQREVTCKPTGHGAKD